MKLHIVTVGKPKLEYAKAGWELYAARLGRFHDVRFTPIPDKFAYNSARIRAAVQRSTIVALDVAGQQYASPELAGFLRRIELGGKEVSFIIGGPEGLPPEIISAAHYRWSLGTLTLPHDLAMVVALEALYRASTINAGTPYHK